jgi:hypothetical protein
VLNQNKTLESTITQASSNSSSTSSHQISIPNAAKNILKIVN